MTHEEVEHEGGNGPRASSGRRPEHHDTEAASDATENRYDEGQRADPAGVARDDSVNVTGGGALREGSVVQSSENSAAPSVAEIEGAVESVVPELSRTIHQSFQMERHEGWSGPVPRPADLAAYEQTLPGAADRILRMAEKSLDSQIATDKSLAEGDVQAVKRGQWQYWSVAMTSLGLAFIVLALGLPAWAAAVIASPAVFQFSASLIRSVRDPKSAPPVPAARDTESADMPPDGEDGPRVDG